ncbi:unnamed protein product [Leptidea sinapis]|uniref:Endonuclease-reverse transcriptase n=1 Tax=Leptidea sinapis TaxID=189913 RepID=A0A5E4Q6N1_9NEOP|nr:unnamed protein product [Leptidea sinapis]
MEAQFQLLFDRMKIEMQKQTTELTNTIMEKIEEKLKPIVEENNILKLKIKNLENKVELLERDKKSKNIIIHGLHEEETSKLQLLEKVKKRILDELHISIETVEINKIHRIGHSKKGDKPRPILISLVNYSKETLERRKALQPKLLAERKKGNFAFIYIIRENINAKNKRKREILTSPQTDLQSTKQPTLTSSKNHRSNVYDIMRVAYLSMCMAVLGNVQPATASHSPRTGIWRRRASVASPPASPLESGSAARTSAPPDT